jgi:hypothetical protein
LKGAFSTFALRGESGKRESFEESFVVDWCSLYAFMFKFGAARAKAM